METNLIGILGKKQVGKDTVCKIIQALDIYYKQINSERNKHTFVMQCVYGDEFKRLNVFRNIKSTWDKHSFADNLKACASIIVDCKPEDFESKSFKEDWCKISTNNKCITNREFLQLLGTEVGRSISKTIWIQSLFMKYNKNSKWIIPDVRFINEANYIKFRGGFLIKVERNTGYSDNHISELDLDNYTDYDVLIENNSSITDLIDKVDKIMGSSVE